MYDDTDEMYCSSEHIVNENTGKLRGRGRTTRRWGRTSCQGTHSRAQTGSRSHRGRRHHPPSHAAVRAFPCARYTTPDSEKRPKNSQLRPTIRGARAPTLATATHTHCDHGLDSLVAVCTTSTGARMTSDAAPQYMWISQNVKRPAFISRFV